MSNGRFGIFFARAGLGKKINLTLGFLTGPKVLLER